MKKNFMTPDVRIVRFESKDIITTSVDSMDFDPNNSTNDPNAVGAQERRSIWD